MRKAKTRQQIADEFGVTRKTLYNWFKREGITLTNRLVTPKEQQIIYEKLGNPLIGGLLPRQQEQALH